MATMQEKWLEDLDDLINRVPDIYLPEPIADNLIAKLEEIQQDVLEQIELRSSDW
jgi:hypothetical protein